MTREATAPDDPIERFQRWASDTHDAAMCLATVTGEGRPTARTVLLHSVDKRGFTFFTSSRSPKAAHLHACPAAALVWYWPPHRQVRAEGSAQQLPDEDCDAAWAKRPRPAQLQVWAADQSSVVPGDDELKQRFDRIALQFTGKTIPRSPTWIGYRLEPDRIEFWKHSDDALHRRDRYTRLPGTTWLHERLAP